MLENGYLFRDLKPVNWCFDCGSALAEAEVEYADRKDPSIHVAFKFNDKAKLAQAFGLPQAEDGSIFIWTTTPWPLPSNQPLNVPPAFYHPLLKPTSPPTPRPILTLL